MLTSPPGDSDTSLRTFTLPPILVLLGLANGRFLLDSNTINTPVSSITLIVWWVLHKYWVIK